MPVHFDNSAAVSLPIVGDRQRKTDASKAGKYLANLFRRRGKPERPRVVQTRGATTAVLEGQASRRKLNLGVMLRSASPKPQPQPAKQVEIAPQPARQVGIAPQPGLSADISVVEVLKPVIGSDDRVDAALDAVAAIAREIRDLARLQMDTQNPSRSLPDKSAAVKYLTERNRMQDEVTAQLIEIEALLDTEQDPATRRSLEGARRNLMCASIGIEYPQTCVVVGGSFRAPPPPDIVWGVDGDDPAQYDDAIAYLDGYAAGDARTGAVPALVERLERTLENLRASAPRSGDALDDWKTRFDYVSNLKSAVRLTREFEEAAAGLDLLRQRFSKDPELSGVSMGRLCREISHVAPTMSRFAVSSSHRDQETVLGSLNAVTDQMLRGSPPDMFVTDDPGVSRMLSVLRRNHCEELAANKFLREAGNAVPAQKPGAAADGRRLYAVHEIRDQVADGPLAKAVDDAVSAGATAAANREAYFAQLGCVSRALKDSNASDAGFIYKGSIWLKAGSPGTSNDPDGARAIDFLKSLGKRNPQAAFQVAVLAMLEYRTAISDRDILGLPWTADAAIADFDPQRVLDYAGLDKKTLEKLGYSGLDGKTVLDKIKKLARNFDNPKELHALLSEVRSITVKTLRNRDVHEAASSFAAENPSALARRILAGRLAAVAGIPGYSAEARSLTASDPVVVGQLRQSNEELREGLRARDGDVLERLKTDDDGFLEADKGIVDAMRRRQAVENALKNALKDIRGAGQSRELGDVDFTPYKPAGLRSAKLILETLAHARERQQAIDNDLGQEMVDHHQQLIDGNLLKLRGLDEQTHRRPWGAKLAALFGRGRVPTLDSLQKLEAVAKGIVYVRETAISEKQRIDETIVGYAASREKILQKRMNVAPDLVGAARQMIRTAILSHWPADNATEKFKAGAPAVAYEPLLFREKIEETLRSWGFDIDVFRTELQAELTGTLSLHDLKTLSEQMADFDAGDGRGTVGGSRKSGWEIGNVILNRKKMDELFQDEMLSLVGGLRDGEKYDFKSGLKVSVNSSKIPLDPSATISIRAKMHVSGLDNFIVERSGDTIRLTVRSGVEIGAGAEVVLGHKLSDVAKAEATFGADVAGSRMAGWVMSYNNDMSGMLALNRLLLESMGDRQLDASSMEDVAVASRTKEYAGKTSLKAKGQIKMGLEVQPFGNGGDAFSPSERTASGRKSGAKNKVGPGIEAGVELALSGGRKVKETRGVASVAYETETQGSVSVSAFGKVYLRAPTVLGSAVGGVMTAADAQSGADDAFSKENGDGTYDVGSITAKEDILNLKVGVSQVITCKRKNEYAIAQRADARERLTKSEINLRTNIGSSWSLASRVCSTPALRAKLEANDQFRFEYEALLKQMRPDEYLQVTSVMRPEIIANVNDLAALESQAQKNGDTSLSVRLRARIEDIFNDNANYMPTKITLWSKETLTGLANRGHAYMARVDIIADSAHEEGRLVLKVPS